MASRKEMEIRRDFWNTALTKMREAYLMLIDGGVKSYSLEGRILTALDIPDLLKQIETAESKVDELTSMLSGGKARRAFGVIPRDW